jgi:hypothetical protein
MSGSWSTTVSATAVAHQAEADKVDLGGMLLTSANIGKIDNLFYSV